MIKKWIEGGFPLFHWPMNMFINGLLLLLCFIVVTSLVLVFARSSISTDFSCSDATKQSPEPATTKSSNIGILKVQEIASGKHET
jgi:hypothetical protein